MLSFLVVVKNTNRSLIGQGEEKEFFGGTGVHTQGFTLATQAHFHVSHSASPKKGKLLYYSLLPCTSKKKSNFSPQWIVS
jgi:hypothetical protein